MADGGGLWRAMAGSPRRFLRSRWPWRCLAYLVTSALVGIGVLFATVAVAVVPPAVLLLGLSVAKLERRRLRWFAGSPAKSPHAVPSPGPGAWLRLRLTEAATWREFGYLLILALVLPALDLAAASIVLNIPALIVSPVVLAAGGAPYVAGGIVPIETPGAAWIAAAGGTLGAVPVVYAICGLAGAQATFARRLLAPRQAELDRRVEELAGSRARLVDAFDTERRRIERDLHDGAQQHLVLLTMTLGLARLELEGSHGPARGLLADAQQQAQQALSSIRELIHGIHPQILTDLGLAAAVGELAERSPVPVEVDIRVGKRPPRSIEAGAYFVVSEAVTNAVKHAGATRITVTGSTTADRLVVEVTDDGAGGADPSRGSGLKGLTDRASVLDGSVTITSPAGGPTTLHLELPCHCG